MSGVGEDWVEIVIPHQVTVIVIIFIIVVIIVVTVIIFAIAVTIVFVLVNSLAMVVKIYSDFSAL